MSAVVLLGICLLVMSAAGLVVAVQFAKFQHRTFNVTQGAIVGLLRLQQLTDDRFLADDIGRVIRCLADGTDWRKP